MKRRRSLLNYLWVSPVSLLGLGLGLLAFGFGATMKRRSGVIEIVGNTHALAEQNQLARGDHPGTRDLGRKARRAQPTAAMNMCMCGNTNDGEFTCAVHVGQ